MCNLTTNKTNQNLINYVNLLSWANKVIYIHVLWYSGHQNKDDYNFTAHRAEVQLCTYASGLISVCQICMLLYTFYFSPTAVLKVLRKKAFGHSQTCVATCTRAREYLPGDPKVASATLSSIWLLLASEMRPIKFLIIKDYGPGLRFPLCLKQSILFPIIYN